MLGIDIIAKNKNEEPKVVVSLDGETIFSDLLVEQQLMTIETASIESLISDMEKEFDVLDRLHTVYEGLMTKPLSYLNVFKDELSNGLGIDIPTVNKKNQDECVKMVITGIENITSGIIACDGISDATEGIMDKIKEGGTKAKEIIQKILKWIVGIYEKVVAYIKRIITSRKSIVEKLDAIKAKIENGGGISKFNAKDVSFVGYSAKDFKKVAEAAENGKKLIQQIVRTVEGMKIENKEDALGVVRKDIEPFIKDFNAKVGPVAGYAFEMTTAGIKINKYKEIPYVYQKRDSKNMTVQNIEDIVKDCIDMFAVDAFGEGFDKKYTSMFSNIKNQFSGEFDSPVAHRMLSAIFNTVINKCVGTVSHIEHTLAIQAITLGNALTPKSAKAE